jgi:hypothetical protein
MPKLLLKADEFAVAITWVNVTDTPLEPLVDSSMTHHSKARIILRNRGQFYSGF